MPRPANFIVPLLLFTSAIAVPAKAGGPKLSAEEIVAHHLESMASAEARASLKSRVVQGSSHYEMIIGGVGKADGQAMMISEGHKLDVSLSLPSNVYPGERFRSDGDRFDVAVIRAGSRSTLGTFIYSEGQVLCEGLLGGVLSTSWPLFDLSSRRARVKYDGPKKIDGKMLHQLSYSAAHGGSDLRIQLFFDPENFRHVRTVYRVTMPAPMALSPNQSPQQVETNFIIQEDFSDFRSFDGFTLPTRWKLRYNIEGSRSISLLWEVAVSRVAHNVSIDPSAFALP